MDTINHIVGSRSRTVINITHHTSQLANADRVLLLSNGKLLEQEKQLTLSG
jgi:ABC-type transport system involved in cytochrome bd biosynthesis fused ATPase/permease subunit